MLLSGIVVATPWGKFRENFERVSPYESAGGVLSPAITVKSSVAVEINSSNVIRIRGTEYKFDGKPERLPSGFTVIHLGVKK